jgi:Xaa-Pro aminopeptidase
VPSTADLFPADRLDKAAAAAAAAGVDALLLTPGADLRYLTGYDALPLERLTCLVLPATGPATLVVPRLEHPAAVASPAGRLGIDIIGWGETDDPYTVVARLLHEALGTMPDSVGLGNRMWAEQVLRFRSVMPGAEQSLAGHVLRDLRMTKSPAEVDALREAAEAIDRVHARMGEWLRVGRTEREVGRDIAEAIVAEGHKTVNFVIVGSGPNGASPHHDLSERVIEAGDVVVIDIGGPLSTGYNSDCTRTYAVGGEPPADVKSTYAVLQEAQDAACRAVRPGVSAESVDAAARQVIAAAGFGDQFVHRTGHGIGLDVHEAPYIVGGNELELTPGMAFSVEPGIYLEGRWGARIEDIVVVTEDGAERLNGRPRDLVVL